MSFALATQIAQAFTLIAGILTRNILGPVNMGIWATLQIVLHYAGYTSLGTSQGISREIPYYLGKQRADVAESLKNSIGSFQTLTALITALGIVIAAFYLQSQLEPIFFWGLIFTASLVVLQRINAFIISLLRAYKCFDIASRQMIYSSIVNLALIIVFTIPLKLYGFFLAMIFSLLFNIIYNLSRQPFKFKFVLDHNIAKVISFGFPLMLLGVLEALYKSIDKIVIVNQLGFEALGYYSIAMMVSNFLSQLPNSLSIVMLPHFHEKYGERETIDGIKSYVNKAAAGLAHIMALFIGFSWIIMPPFIMLILPNYTDGIIAAQNLLISNYFFALLIPYGIVMVTLKKHLILFPLVGISLAASIILNLLAIKYGYGIAGVAIATGLSLGINFILVFMVAGRILYNFTEGLRLFIRILIPFFALILLLSFLNFFIQFDSPVITALVRLIVLSVAFLPFFIWVFKEYGLIAILKEKLSRTK